MKSTSVPSTPHTLNARPHGFWMPLAGNLGGAWVDLWEGGMTFAHEESPYGGREG